MSRERSGATFHTQTRADLNGLPLQVGIWQANFTAGVQSGILDNFSITDEGNGLGYWRMEEIGPWGPGSIANVIADSSMPDVLPVRHGHDGRGAYSSEPQPVGRR